MIPPSISGKPTWLLIPGDNLFASLSGSTNSATLELLDTYVCEGSGDFIVDLTGVNATLKRNGVALTIPITGISKGYVAGDIVELWGESTTQTCVHGALGIQTCTQDVVTSTATLSTLGLRKHIPLGMIK